MLMFNIEICLIWFFLYQASPLSITYNIKRIQIFFCYIQQNKLLFQMALFVVQIRNVQFLQVFLATDKPFVQGGISANPSFSTYKSFMLFGPMFA